jgi:4-carboxymuconolactone decarboxylase
LPVDHQYEGLLRRLALNDEMAVESALQMRLADVGNSGLAPKTSALVRLAGLVALQASSSSYQWSVSAAFAAGATDEEVVGVLVALAPVIGVARVNRAAVDVAAAIGCDLDLPPDG